MSLTLLTASRSDRMTWIWCAHVWLCERNPSSANHQYESRLKEPQIWKKTSETWLRRAAQLGKTSPMRAAAEGGAGCDCALRSKRTEHVGGNMKGCRCRKERKGALCREMCFGVAAWR
eukprot:6184259-Pleurochrysis_carterae.AAC.3